MKKPSNWKDRFRDGIYACPELQSKKTHRDLLGYLVHRANPNIRFCWQTQSEMARIQGCSVRNIKDLLNYLVELGAIYVVRIKDMPKHDQGVIHKLTPRKLVANANAYFICEQWAEDQLSIEGEPALSIAVRPAISAEAQAHGREKANSSRKRYAPIDLVPDLPPSDPLHDEWQILNSGVQVWGSPTSPSNRGVWGSPTTDMNLKNTPAENLAPTNGAAVFELPPSKADQAESLNSSPALQQAEPSQHGYGGGEAIACVPRPQALVAEGSEREAAGARDRRVS
ncbi:hypothetical protein [Rhizobium rhizogenes]|uniref:hypothetical protein n=1 Tax=Rhizobium rhizogenes TaxID=359 RepID=UPI001572AACB|nr:hypothetical protein [Rhizobium rhizogenes]NTG09241.1 hypothetical protein [Rhizobium rhizogenes]